MSPLLFALGLYVLAQLAIGAWVSRRIRTEVDYLVAGRSLSLPMTTFTVFATWFGAETCIGAAGAIYADGLSGGTADPFGYGLCLLLMGAIFAAPLWRRRLTTLGDFFAQRYDRRVEQLAVVLMVPASLLWAAAQIRAFGQVLATTTGLEVTVMVTLAAAVVALYTVFGGLLADAYTDLIQGTVLLVGLVVLAAVVLGDTGLAPLTAVEPERFRLFSLDGRSPLDALEAWAIPICGSVLAAELVSRVIAARSPGTARSGALLGGSLYLTVGLIPVAIGLMGPQLMPDLADPEQVLPAVARAYLPTVLYVVFAGALVSAILSTVDSALLVAAGLTSHNLVAPRLPNLSERGRLRLARTGVLLFAGVAYVVALHAEGVYALVLEASAFGSAGLFVTVTVGLFTGFGGVRSATWALLAGMAVWILAAYVLGAAHPFLLSLAAAASAYALGALLPARHPAATPSP